MIPIKSAWGDEVKRKKTLASEKAKNTKGVRRESFTRKIFPLKTGDELRQNCDGRSST